MSKQLRRPDSAGNTVINLLGALSLVYSIFLCRESDRHGVEATLVALMTYAFILTMLEIVVLRAPARPENGLDLKRFKPSLSRVGYKLLGIGFCYAVIGFLYWLFPEYHGNFFYAPNWDGFYVPFGDAVTLMMPLIAALAAPYVVIVDGLMREPEDRYWRLGRLLVGKPHGLTRKAQAQLFWSWVARAFFVALLFVYANNSFNQMVDYDFSSPMNTVQFYSMCFDLVLTLGLMMAVAGHMLTLRLVGNHVRSVDPFAGGWLVCLFCFQPFKSFMNDYVAPRGPVDGWVQALAENPSLQGVWAGLIIVTLLGSLMADISLGSRFSYLLHRGVVTGGMYRFSKHPSYLFTWLQFLLIYFPLFAFQQADEVAKAGLALTALGVLYYLRARTEERHLSYDPVYVQYALWMNEHGALRWLGRLLPALRYRAPAGRTPLDKPYEGIS